MVLNLSKDALGTLDRFSPAARQEALQLLERRSQGGRISFTGVSNETRAAYNSIATTREGERLIGQGSAIRQGFRSEAEQQQAEAYVPPQQKTSLKSGQTQTSVPISKNVGTQQYEQPIGPQVIRSFSRGETAETRNLATGEKVTLINVGAGKTQSIVSVQKREELSREIPGKTIQVKQRGRTGTEERGTRTDLAPTQEFDIRTQPYLTRRIVGETKDPRTGRVIPVYGEVLYIDPTVEGPQYERKATAEEIEKYESGTRTLEASTKDQPNFIRRGLGEVFGTFQQDVYYINQVNSNKLKEIGFTDANIEIFAEYVGNSPISQILGKDKVVYNLDKGLVELKLNPIKEFIAGGTEAILKDIRDKPFTNVAFIGLGFGIGAAVRGTAIGVSKLPLAVGNIVKPIGQVTGIGLGAKIASAEYVRLSAELYGKNARESGEILGIETLRLTEIGIGGRVGARSVDIVQDFFRTIGRQELDFTKIIAPEYLRGQKYPTGFRGQTAAQLKAEFYNKILPNEKDLSPKGFTASPQPFVGNVIQEGTSEVPGLFSAPRLSATFLKLQGENAPKVIDVLNFLDVSKPTILRIKFQSIEYQPGTSPSSLLASKRYNEEFFENIIGSGRTILPAAKTEKEVITAAGSILELKPSNFYIKFQGRKIPIEEFDVLKGDNIRSVNTKTIQEVFSSYSSVSSKKPSYLNPISLSALSVSKDKESYNSVYYNVSQNISSILSLSKIKYSSSVNIYRSNISSSSSLSPIISNKFSLKSIDKSSKINKLNRINSNKFIPKRTITNIIPTYYPKETKKDEVIKLDLDNKKGEGQRGILGFRTYVIRRGKIVYLPGIRERGSALRVGEKQARKSLAATFGIIQTGRTVRAKETRFTPTKQFRSYRIKQGKPIQLTNQFIQRAKFRLSSGTEKREIQKSRRKR